jgi:Txe/YoeB family toxin of toxin-antitoxin system
MAKAQRPVRRSGPNRRAIGLPIRRGALRVFSQRNSVALRLVKGVRSQCCRAAQGSCRTGGLFQACEVPNSPPMLSPAHQKSAIRVAASRQPWADLRKPFRLHALAGYWSRRIDDEHRLVYKIDGDAVLIAQARDHY